MIGEVIESRSWVHASGVTASTYGSIPWTGTVGDTKDDWTLESRGWTIRFFSSGNVGFGRVPFKTKEEAEQWLAQEERRLNADSDL